MGLAVIREQLVATASRNAIAIESGRIWWTVQRR
jgi:hypothetical protein